MRYPINHLDARHFRSRRRSAYLIGAERAKCTSCDEAGGLSSWTRIAANAPPPLRRPKQLNLSANPGEPVKQEKVESAPYSSFAVQSAARGRILYPGDMDAGSVVDGRYEVCRLLSVTGGMGDVYLCLDRKLNRQVAVKLIKPEHSEKPEYRERFQREVDSAIALEGYDVVRIYDYGECADRHTPYCVMEYLRGRDLCQELSARGPFELARALEILLDVCKVIGAAHSRNIVHRDLKPGNLFLEGPPSPRRSVRVLDFGIARFLGDPRDGALTQLGGQPGSPNYMSPEQHKNDLDVGIQADIWALGVILYEMVVGEKAWPGQVYEARKRVLDGAAPSVRTSRPELPSELDRIIQKCLEKEPAARYPSVRKLEDALRRLQNECQRPSETLPTLVCTALPPKRSRSHRLPLALALGGLSILVVVLSAVKPWSRNEISPAVTVRQMSQLLPTGSGTRPDPAMPRREGHLHSDPRVPPPLRQNSL